MPAGRKLKLIKSQELEIIKLYKNGLTATKIAIKFNVVTSTIGLILKKYNIVIRNKRILNQEQKDLIIELIKDGTRPSEICKIINIPKHTLYKFKKKYKLKLYKIKLDQDKVFNYIKSNGYQIISSDYINSTVKIDMVCPNNHHCSMLLNNFRKGYRCRQCYEIDNRGENHYNWNPNKSDSERTIIRHQPQDRQWTKNIYKKDDYTCQKCEIRSGCGFKFSLNAHHLNGFHWDIENRYNINNGVTLCRDCHLEFHDKYKRTNNTIIQYNEWNKLNPIIDETLIKNSENYNNKLNLCQVSKTVCIEKSL